jgi:predicted SnoaL-like aldol condensation-catalyzing enzyme
MTRSDVEAVALKEAAIAFLQLAASGKVREAFDNYVAEKFRHHNPFFPGDAEALKSAMEDNASKNPEKVLVVQRALQDGDLVAVHSWVRPTPTASGIAVVHIFRFEGNRIAELWDVGQPVPESSPNEYGMF